MPNNLQCVLSMVDMDDTHRHRHPMMRLRSAHLEPKHKEWARQIHLSLYSALVFRAFTFRENYALPFPFIRYTRVFMLGD
jgi:hypothetical protein